MSNPADGSEYPFYFLAGRTHALVAYALILGGLVGTLLGATPRWFQRVMSVLCWLLIATSLIIISAYVHEFLQAYFSESVYERAQFDYRLTGPHAWVFWLSTISAAAPQAYWLPACRRRPVLMLLIAVLAIGPGWWMSRWQ